MQYIQITMTSRIYSNKTYCEAFIVENDDYCFQPVSWYFSTNEMHKKWTFCIPPPHAFIYEASSGLLHNQQFSTAHPPLGMLINSGTTRSFREDAVNYALKIVYPIASLRFSEDRSFSSWEFVNLKKTALPLNGWSQPAADRLIILDGYNLIELF